MNSKKKYTDYIAQQDSMTENIKLRRTQELEDIRQRVENFTQVAQQDMNKKTAGIVGSDPG